MKQYLGAILVVAALAPLTLDAWADRVHIDSHRKDRDIAIDGDSGDWAGPLVPLGDQPPVSVAAANDNEHLYLVLTASDSAARTQILRQGLIVWFDPEGKDKKHFGIKFPVGDLPTEGGRGNRGAQGDSADRPRPPRPDAFEEPVSRLEVLGPKKDDVHSFVLDRAPGIVVKLGQVEGSIVYELKVPLASSSASPYAIGTKPGATIGLGLETPKVERPAMEGRRGGGMGGFGGGGMGRGGGGMGGRGGGMGGRGGEGGQFVRPKPMKIWATVRLAS